MTLVTKNIAANFAGSFWTALMGFAFIPFYIHLMGVEAYGLIGFYITLQAVFSLFDMGLSISLNREFSRLSVQENPGLEMRAMLRSVEIIYWLITAFILVVLFLLSFFMGDRWFQSSELSSGTIRESIMLMGSAIALQFCTNLYTGGLLGLQKHILHNLILIFVSTLRGPATLLVLWKVSSSVAVFFLLQTAINAGQLILEAYLLWKNLPRSSKRTQFQSRCIRRVWHFAASVGASTILAVVLTQMDKIILSHLLTLERFGYYMLAWTIALSLYRLISPVYTAFFPRFSQLVAMGNTASVAVAYHTSCQLMAVIVFPITITVSLFSQEILNLWTQNPSTAINTHELLCLLIVGTALNGIMHMPYALQLSYGWPQLSLYSNIIAVLILGPAIYLAATNFGAIGPAYVWIALNLGYMIISLQLMHRRLLPSEKWTWYREDFIQPLFASFCVSILGRIALPHSPSAIFAVSTVAFSFGASVIACIMAAPLIRAWLMLRLSRYRLSVPLI